MSETFWATWLDTCTKGVRGRLIKMPRWIRYIKASGGAVRTMSVLWTRLLEMCIRRGLITKLRELGVYMARQVITELRENHPKSTLHHQSTNCLNRIGLQIPLLNIAEFLKHQLLNFKEKYKERIKTYQLLKDTKSITKTIDKMLI